MLSACATGSVSMDGTGRLLQPGTPPATQDNWAKAHQDILDTGNFGAASTSMTLLDSGNDMSLIETAAPGAPASSGDSSMKSNAQEVVCIFLHRRILILPDFTVWF